MGYDIVSGTTEPFAACNGYYHHSEQRRASFFLPSLVILVVYPCAILLHNCCTNMRGKESCLLHKEKEKLSYLNKNI